MYGREWVCMHGRGWDGKRSIPAGGCYVEQTRELQLWQGCWMAPLLDGTDVESVGSDLVLSRAAPRLGCRFGGLQISNGLLVRAASREHDAASRLHHSQGHVYKALQTKSRGGAAGQGRRCE